MKLATSKRSARPSRAWNRQSPSPPTLTMRRPTLDASAHTWSCCSKLNVFLSGFIYIHQVAIWATCIQFNALSIHTYSQGIWAAPLHSACWWALPVNFSTSPGHQQQGTLQQCLKHFFPCAGLLLLSPQVVTDGGNSLECWTTWLQRAFPNVMQSIYASSLQQAWPTSLHTCMQMCNAIKTYNL